MVGALAHSVQIIQVAAEPPVPDAALDAGGLPNRHRGEVREVGVGIADPLHDGELTLVPAGLETFEVRVQAELIVERQHPLILSQGRSSVVIGAVLKRDHGIESIVAAGQLHQHQDPVAGSRARRIGRGGRHTVGEHGRDRRAGEHRNQASLHELAAAKHGFSSPSVQLVLGRRQDHEQQAGLVTGAGRGKGLQPVFRRRTDIAVDQYAGQLLERLARQRRGHPVGGRV